MEVLVVLLSLYLVAINTDLTTIDLLAFSGYKYVGYVISLCFISLSILYFMFYFVLKHIYSFFSSLIWYCSTVPGFSIYLSRMIIGVVAGLLFGRLAYYLCLLWCCAAIFVFMVSNSCFVRFIGAHCREHCRWKYAQNSFCFVSYNFCITWLFCWHILQIRTLRLKLLSEVAAEGKLVRATRNQLRMYLTMSIAAAQPVFMFWLTYHLIR